MPVTLRSRFTPLTYDEIARPLIEQTAAQEAMENAYSEAQDQASQLMAQANEQTDPIAHARLKNYAAALQQQADSLMRNGLNRNSRAALLNTRKRYNQDVVPVQQAVTRRNELMEELRKLRIQNPDMLVERDVIGIDDLLRNPQLDYGSTYNGAMITKRVADAAKAVGDSMVSMETAGHLTPYQIKVLEKHGFTADEIAAAVAGGQDAKSQMLAGIRDRVLGSIDVYNKGNDATKARALSYANEGLYAGIGSSRYSLVADERAKAELGWEFDKKRMDYQYALRQKELAEQQRQQLLGASPKYQTRPVLTAAEQEEQISNVNKINDFIGKGFIVQKEDGSLEVTELGRKALEEGQKLTDDMSNPNASFTVDGMGEMHMSYETSLIQWQITGSNAFHDFMTGIGAYEKKDRPKGGHSYYHVDNDKLNGVAGTSSSEAYDSYLGREYTRQIAKSHYGNVAGMIHSAASNGNVYGYDISNEGGKYTLKRGNAIDLDDITGDNIKGAAVVYGHAGNYLELSLGGGKKVRVPLSTFDMNADRMLQGNSGTIAAYAEALQNGYLFTKEGLPIETAIMLELNSMGDNALSVFGVYTPEDTKVNNTYQQSTIATF